MTLLRETPKDHGILLDHDPKGRRRLTVTLAGRSARRNGRRLQSATGEQYARCFQAASTVLWKMQGKRLQPQDEDARQYHPISEEEAVQIRLLMDAMNISRRPGMQTPWAGPSPKCTTARARGGTPAPRTATAPERCSKPLS